MGPEDTLKGNEAAATAHFSAELVTSGQTSMVDATVAQAYATLALAQEMRANTLAIIWSSPETGNDVVERSGRELARLLSWVEM